ncbi:Small secreted domain [Asanoa hainanensis]|uniref:Small secreted domain n=1 Tax=Asanoa hainanensis TaxID=560556 RepID=A0A239LP56_9ACTN|nr:chaplin family protein [Asanoa hainanensis]SNT32231.1 Small secreted domain [Asanoa hainanensis]
MTNKRRRRLVSAAALPAAGLAVVAGALALSGQAASAAGLGDASVPDGDAATTAADRAAEITDSALSDAVADGAPLDLPDAAPSDETPSDEDSAADEKGPADLPAAAKFGSGVSHIASGHNAGILNGTQVVVPITIDVDACGNSIAAIGSAASASCDDDEEEPPPPPVDEEPPTAQNPPPPPVEEPPVAEPELPRTGLPVGSIAGIGGVLTAGGAAMQLAGVRTNRYVGRHRRGPRPS